VTFAWTKDFLVHASLLPKDYSVMQNLGFGIGLLPERQVRTAYSVFVAAYLPQASTSVGRGENSGRTLQEFNIVRQFRSIGNWSGHAAVFRTPVDSFPADASRVAILVQREGQGPITGSAAIALH
jgi:hypothetical protein